MGNAIKCIDRVFLLTILLSAIGEMAWSSSTGLIENRGLSAIVEYGLEHSLDKHVASGEVKVQTLNERVVKQGHWLPQVSVSIARQRLSYDRQYNDPSQGNIVNKGYNTSLALTLSYDLQKLFSPEVTLARHEVSFSRIQEKIKSRDIVRNIKKSYFSILAIHAELEELNRLVKLLSKIEGFLKSEKRAGVNTEIDRRQFQAQKSGFLSERTARESELDAATFQLASLINADANSTRAMLDPTAPIGELQFADRTELNSESIASINDGEMLDALSRDHSLAKLEHESYGTLPYPTVYAKVSRDHPSYPSSDGPITMGEVGLSIPIEGFVTRRTQKEYLGAKSQLTDLALRKAMLEYRNQIRINIQNINRFKNQRSVLQTARHETEALQEKAFTYYAQKRMDVLGVLDVLQRYLQASKDNFANDFQIRSADAELEYLLGGAP